MPMGFDWAQQAVPLRINRKKLLAITISPPLKTGGLGGFLKKRIMLKYNDNLKSIGRRLRQNLTDSERALWTRLRSRQLLGVQFYRQKPIGDYIVNFYAPKAELVIEIDGSQHVEAHHAEQDKVRDEHLCGLGLLVLRFDSRQVLKETEGVLGVIYRTIVERTP